MANNSAIKAGKAVVEISVLDKVQSGLARVQKRLTTWAQGLAIGGAALSGAGAGILTPLLGAVNSFVSTGSDLADMSARTGESAETLQELGFAAEQTGASMSDLEAGVRKLAQFENKLASGNKAALHTLEQLGIGANQFRDSSTTDQITMLAEALTRVEDPSQRAALAMQVLGKSGVKLLPMLSGGAAGLQAFSDRFRELNLGMSEEQVAKADLLGDKWGELSQQFWNIVNQTGAALADTLIVITDAAITGASAVIEFVKNNQWLIVSVAAAGAGLIAMGSLLAATAVGMYSVSAAIGVVSGMITLASVLWTSLGVIKTTLVAVNASLATAITGTGISAAFTAVQTVILTGTLNALNATAAVTLGIFAALASPLAIVAGVILLVTAALVGGTYALLNFTAMGQAAQSKILNGMISLFHSTKSAISGIFDAIVSGNWGLAGQIAMAYLNAAWVEGLSRLKQISFEIIRGILQTILDHVTWMVERINAVIKSQLLDSLENALDSASKTIDRTFNVGMMVEDAKIKEAKDELYALSKQASDARREQDAARLARAKNLFSVNLPSLTSAAEVGGPSGATMGAFSSYVTGLLGRSVGMEADMKRTADNTDEMVDHLETIANKIEESGDLVFE